MNNSNNKVGQTPYNLFVDELNGLVMTVDFIGSNIVFTLTDQMTINQDALPTMSITSYDIYALNKLGIIKRDDLYNYENFVKNTASRLVEVYFRLQYFEAYTGKLKKLI